MPQKTMGKKKKPIAVSSLLQNIERDRQLIGKYWGDYSCGRIEVEGLLPAKELREYGKGKPCPRCNLKMVRYPISNVRMEGWLKASSIWMHPRQVTIDHRYPKSVFPEMMFDPNNFELVCYTCNQNKSDFFGSIVYEECQDILKWSKSVRF